MSEQRQSARFDRRFLVTDYQDANFELAFDGVDVNLTGLSFTVPDAEFFMPGQPLTVRVRGLETAEDYELDSVEVVHVHSREGRVICGCHITQVSSDQLLAHHRLVMLNEEAAEASMAVSELHEFNFNEKTSAMSVQAADFQQAGFALNLAVEELTGGLQADETDWLKHEQSLKTLAQSLSGDQQTQVQALLKGLKGLQQQQEGRNEQVLALSLLAKMLVHTPSSEQDRLAWQTLIRDFETRFLNERMLLAYDLMHQGLEAREALNESERQLGEDQA